MALNSCALHPVCRMPLGKECVTRVPFTDHNPGTLLAVRQRCLRLWVTRAKSDSPYFLDDRAVGSVLGQERGSMGLIVEEVTWPKHVDPLPIKEIGVDHF